MNLTRIFTREEPVAGLEISEGSLRLVLLELDKKHFSFQRIKSPPAPAPLEAKPPEREAQSARRKVAFFVEEPLESGVLENGAINQPRFLAALHNLIKKCPVKIRYVVASIPSDQIYSRIFSFPKTIRGQKLEQSMKLTIGFQLPFKPEEVYLDWEKIAAGTSAAAEGKSKSDSSEETKDRSLQPRTEEQNEIFLAACKKRVIDVYIEALNVQGLSPVVIEFHPQSFLRVIDLPENKTALIKIIGTTSTTIAVVKNRILRFSRTIPAEFLSGTKLNEEARKIKDFYGAEHGPVAEEINIDEAKIVAEYNKPEMQGASGKWLVSFGAALRGLRPRDEDTLTSLLPVGTEEAYEYHKAIIFSEFISNLAVGIAAFFSGAFIVAWILMNFVESKTLSQLEKLNSLPIPSDADAVVTKTRVLNGLIGVESDAVKTMPRWSAVLEELKSEIGAGITVTNVNMPSPEGMASLTSVARDRTALDALKKTFAASPFFADAKFSATDLGQTNNIPFSVTFRIKEPAALYSANN